MTRSGEDNEFVLARDKCAHRLIGTRQQVVKATAAVAFSRSAAVNFKVHSCSDMAPLQ